MDDFLDNLKFKIKDGTTRSTDNLCPSCTHGHIRRGVTPTSDLVFCRRIEKPLKDRVAECSDYYPKGIPDIYDYKQIAWRIDPTKKHKPGFITPPEKD